MDFLIGWQDGFCAKWMSFRLDKMDFYWVDVKQASEMAVMQGRCPASCTRWMLHETGAMKAELGGLQVAIWMSCRDFVTHTVQAVYREQY